MSSIISFIKQALQKASKISKDKFGKVSGETKGKDNNQVLTQTDLAIGKFIINEIKKNFPTYNIIDEEAGVIDSKSNFTWVIDPIDGTSNFASGLPHYGIMLGLLHKDIPIAGGVMLPYFNELYLAEKGKGAFCNGKQIHVTSEKNLLKMLVAYGIDGRQDNPEFSRKEGKIIGELVLHIRNLRASGSVYDTMMVAKGKYGGFLSQAGKIWDNVAMHVIIEEAGGIYTDFFGKPMNYTNALKRTKETFTWCAAAPQLHIQLQKIINSNFIPTSEVD